MGEAVAIACVLAEYLQRRVLGNSLERPCGGRSDAVDGDLLEAGPCQSTLGGVTLLLTYMLM